MKKRTKAQRMKFHTKMQGRADNTTGYKQSAKWRTKNAKTMIDYENLAKEKGVTVAQVIAEDIS